MAKQRTTLADRSRPKPDTDPTEEMKRRFLQTVQTDLHAKSGLPTLAERMKVEGVKAQMGKEKPRKQLPTLDSLRGRKKGKR